MNMEPMDEHSKEHENMLQCPVCGFYCLGNGGFFCIDKPKLCGLADDSLFKSG